MNDQLSLSIFTIEINGKPTLALEAKKHQEAEGLCEQDWLRADLNALTSKGVPLCDAKAAMRVRLARSAEAALYRQVTESTKPSDDINIVYLVDLDE